MPDHNLGGSIFRRFRIHAKAASWRSTCCAGTCLLNACENILRDLQRTEAHIPVISPFDSWHIDLYWSAYSLRHILAVLALATLLIGAFAMPYSTGTVDDGYSEVRSCPTACSS